MSAARFLYTLIDQSVIWMDDHDLPRKKPRALTYSEMMNGGRSRIDEETHELELEMRRREITLERHVNHLEQSLKIAE